MANYPRHKPEMRDEGIDLEIRFKEKEKLRDIYQIPEKELKRYVKEAITSTQKPKEDLFKKLETRLDSVVYRLGFVENRKAALNIIKSGHVKVNEVKRDDPSFHLKQRDIIEIKGNGHYGLKDRLFPLPGWLTRKDKIGRINRLPHLRDADKDINLEYVIEYYALV